MKLRVLTVAATLLLGSGLAFANHCPGDMKKIDEALAANPQVAAADLAEVKKLRAEGEVLHKAGDHDKSLETLGKAMKILKIQ
jgi:hypothetical protein